MCMYDVVWGCGMSVCGEYVWCVCVSVCVCEVCQGPRIMLTSVVRACLETLNGRFHLGYMPVASGLKKNQRELHKHSIHSINYG